MNDFLDRVLFLEKTEIFKNLNLDELSQIAGIMEVEKYDEGEILFLKGDRGNSAYVIMSGKIEIYLPGKKEDHIIVTLSEGDFFGEMALLDGESRSASARTINKCRLYVLNRRNFLNLLNLYPSIALDIIATFSGRIRDGNSKLTQFKNALKGFSDVYDSVAGLLGKI